MEISYAQNLEDYHLSLAFPNQTQGFYVDIGAGHPIADNVSFWFYEQGWRGLVAEPQDELANLYAKLRPRDSVYCGLVGRETGEADFYAVDQLHGLSSMVQENALKAKRFGSDHTTQRKRVIKLDDLCDSYNCYDVDFLKIDVEGAEMDVLMGANWERFRPKVILVEAIQPSSGEPAWEDWEPTLLSKGYQFVLFDTLNRFYVASECSEILARFPRERGAWNCVRHLYEFGRAPENPLHPDYDFAQELVNIFWANLPYLDEALIVSLLAKSRNTNDTQALEKLVRSDAFRAAIGRIACGYDGGQIQDNV